MGDAISIEQRLHDLFAGWRQKDHQPQPDRESPREMERRAVERLYGGHPSVLVHVEQESGEDST
jgi:hypothetical protein